ncbi:hypothetical protein HDV05_000238 [Chytridiales sp. JEL 0842]|nr:hypothetical protein HDV05_000238 [Chytridiales sp. JEL 0842]
MYAPTESLTISITNDQYQDNSVIGASSSAFSDSSYYRQVQEGEYAEYDQQEGEYGVAGGLYSDVMPSNNNSRRRGGRSQRGKTTPYDRPDKGSKEDLKGYIRIENLHFTITSADLLALLSSIGDLYEDPILLYDRSGRSLGTATAIFTSLKDAERAALSLHDTELGGSRVIVNVIQKPQVKPASVLDRLGPKKGGNSGTTSGDVYSRLGPVPAKSVSERLGAKLTDDAQEEGYYESRDRGYERGGSRSGGRYNSSRSGGGRGGPSSYRTKKSAVDLDKEMEEYLKSDKIFDPSDVPAPLPRRGSQSNGWGRGGGERKDWDDPRDVDPLGNGASGGRVVLNYDDDQPAGGGADMYL